MSSPFHEAAAVAHCVQHPALRASYVCSDCAQSWCSACVQHVKLEAARPVALCPQCQGLCERPGQTLPRSSTTFLRGLTAALTFPLRGTSLFILLAGTLLNVLTLSLGGSFLSSGLFMVLGFAGGAFMLGFLRYILLDAVDGGNATATWAELQPQNWTETALQLLSVYLVCFGPWTFCRVWLRPETPLLIWGCRGLLVLGAFYFPMALLAVVMHDDVAALNPLLVLLSMLRTAGRYLVLWLCLGAVAGVVLLLESALTVLGHPSLTSTIANGGWVYLSLVAMRAIGWFYFCTKEQLAWG